MFWLSFDAYYERKKIMGLEQNLIYLLENLKMQNAFSLSPPKIAGISNFIFKKETLIFRLHRMQ